MLVEKFKLPQTTYEELCKIIIAYGNEKGSASLYEISNSIGKATFDISRNSGFLVAVNILGNGTHKAATPEGRDLSHALEHNVEEDIKKMWKKIINENDFLTKILTAIKIRKGMEESGLTAHIVYSAGQPKKAGYLTGARTIIEIFRKAELVKEEDGKIVIVNNLGSFQSIPSVEKQIEPEKSIETIKIEANSIATEIPIQIHINVNCGIDDLENLAIHLNTLKAQLTSFRKNVDQNI